MTKFLKDKPNEFFDEELGIFVEQNEELEKFDQKMIETIKNFLIENKVTIIFAFIFIWNGLLSEPASASTFQKLKAKTPSQLIEETTFDCIKRNDYRSFDLRTGKIPKQMVPFNKRFALFRALDHIGIPTQNLANRNIGGILNAKTSENIFLKHAETKVIKKIEMKIRLLNLSGGFLLNIIGLSLPFLVGKLPIGAFQKILETLIKKEKKTTFFSPKTLLSSGILLSALKQTAEIAWTKRNQYVERKQTILGQVKTFTKKNTDNFLFYVGILIAGIFLYAFKNKILDLLPSMSNRIINSFELMHRLFENQFKVFNTITEKTFQQSQEANKELSSINQQYNSYFKDALKVSANELKVCENNEKQHLNVLHERQLKIQTLADGLESCDTLNGKMFLSFKNVVKQIANQFSSLPIDQKLLDDRINEGIEYRSFRDLLQPALNTEKTAKEKREEALKDFIFHPVA